MARPELVIFDCDGVLIDSELISAEVLIGELRTLGIAIEMGFFHAQCLGRPFPEVAARISAYAGHPLPEDFESSYRRRLIEQFQTGLREMAGVTPMLERLAIPFCLATSSSLQRVSASLAITGLAHFFADRIFTASMVSRGKPAPDLFLFAARQLGAPPGSCLVIEDSATGLIAAQAAGMRAWWFNGGSHLRGVTASLPGVAPERAFDDMSRFLPLLEEDEAQVRYAPIG